MTQLVRKIVIVGGGTSGWMCAAALSKIMGTQNYDIKLVESEEIGTVGVGEATIPMVTLFNEILGLDEDEFVRETNATFKLGIHFVDWRALGTDYFHPFGVFGIDMDGIGFSNYWHRLARMGGSPDYGRYNAETMAARENKFGRTPKIDSSGLPRVNYAFQFDASLYAAYLRRYSEKLGAVRKEGKIVKVNQHPESGFITSLQMNDGSIVDGDFFIDCSGFRGLLIEQTLKTGYDDWSQWLPCNSAAAVPCEKADGPVLPFTRSTAREAGWQWRIPLQHRTGNGYVFCSEYISDDEACTKLLSRLDGKALKDPKILKFTTGRRRKAWNKNVVTLGLASGFLEPLESTSIHLVQVGIAKLLTLFPKNGFYESVIAQYNWETEIDYINIKDFLIAHYKVTEREDTPFWKHCKYMDVPESLSRRLAMYTATGHAGAQNNELFKEASWFAVLMGQGLVPRDYHPLADTISEDDLKLRMSKIRTGITDRVNGLQSHDTFIAKNCSAAMLEKM